MITEEAELLDQLRRGYESAFVKLINQFHASLVRIAEIYVRDRATAEDVAQETWIAVFQGVSRFEARSSLKTWLFSILVNRARTRAQRDGRSVPISYLANTVEDEPSVPADRFDTDGHWRDTLETWPESKVEEMLLSKEVQSMVLEQIARLPDQQRTVITLRDLEGWSTDEVCNLLQISESNQRVLLHRARSQVRRALEKYRTL